MGSANSPFNEMLWGMLIAGGALSLAGLARSYERFWHWRQARALYHGEMIAAAERLKRGQEISVSSHTQCTGHENHRRLLARVTDVSGRSLTLALDESPDLPLTMREGGVPLPPWMKLGATVDGIFTNEDARYRFETTIQDARAVGCHWLLTLAVPRWLEREQRRRYFRVALSLPATFECTDGYQCGANRTIAAPPPQHGALINLSAGGLCADLMCGESPIRAAQLMEQFTPDSILRVRLPIAALSSQSVLVRVRQCNTVIVRGGLGVRIACVFLSMPSWEQELIAQKVHAVQSEQLHERRKA